MSLRFELTLLTSAGSTVITVITEFMQLPIQRRRFTSRILLTWDSLILKNVKSIAIRPILIGDQIKQRHVQVQTLTISAETETKCENINVSSIFLS
jgi:hypothetical protein